MAKKNCNHEIVARAQKYAEGSQNTFENWKYLKSVLIKALLEQKETIKENVSDTISKIPIRVMEDEEVGDCKYVRLADVLEAIKHL